MKNLYISDIYFEGVLSSDSYLSDLPAVRFLSENKHLSITQSVTFFVGENGTGKSTLLEAVAVAYGFNAEGGTRNFSFTTNDTHSELYEHILLSKRQYAQDGYFLRAESFYNAATYIDQVYSKERESRMETPYGDRSLHCQSHGESFLSLIQNRFTGNALYILDEPEAALSPMRQLTLIAEISGLVKNNSQFIIATHSPILMAFPNAQILEFSSDGIRPSAYTDTEHYRITKQFLDNPDRMLKILCE